MSEQTRIIVVDHDPDARFRVQGLAVQAGFAVCGQAGLGTEAVALAASERPDAVLCGLREPVARVQQTIESLAHELPSVPVVVYAEESDLGLIRKAMQAGARDFIQAPLRPEELRRSIAAALEVEQRRRSRAGENGSAAQGSIVTVFGAKGGIGKTTVAANLAVALARHAGQSTVLVDADDTFGDVAPALAVVPRGTVTGALRAIEGGDAEDVKKLLSYHGSGLAVLPGPENPFEWREIGGERLQRLLQHLARQFDVVLVDTGGTLSEVSLATLEAASLILWLTTPEFASVRDALEALDALRRLDLPEDRLRVVLNKVSPEVEVEPSSIEEALGREIFWTVPYDLRMREAAQLGRTLVDEAQPRTPASSSLKDLALALNGMTPKPRRDGLLRRLVHAGNGHGARQERFDLKVVRREVQP
jgi:pilus assembly protein CpaE